MGMMQYDDMALAWLCFLCPPLTWDLFNSIAALVWESFNSEAVLVLDAFDSVADFSMLEGQQTCINLSTFYCGRRIGGLINIRILTDEQKHMDR